MPIGNLWWHQRCNSLSSTRRQLIWCQKTTGEKTMMNLINLINLKRHVVLISLFWLSASSLYASDWNVLEDKDQVLQTDVCRATTSVVKSAIKMEFSLSFSKDGLSLPVIYLKVTKDAILTSNTI